jgi:class 3 adenylate cyclase
MQATPTILCAALSGRASADALEEGVELLRETAGSCRGRVIKTLSDGIVVRFATPDAAAGAAARMAAAIVALPSHGGSKLGVRIGFHSGPASTALRLAAKAKRGQILTTGSTAGLLGTSSRAFSRHLQAMRLGNAGAATGIYEVSAPPAPRPRLSGR